MDQSRFLVVSPAVTCVAVCPRDCNTVEGRALLPDDIIEIPAGTSLTSYDLLKALMFGRRSIRNFKNLIEGQEREVDYLLYDAPLAMYFHGSPYGDPADPVIAVTYAMLAAEFQELGSCMIGTIAPFFRHERKLREKYGIPPKNRQGIMVIFGYPSTKFHNAIRRICAGVHFC